MVHSAARPLVSVALLAGAVLALAAQPRSQVDAYPWALSGCASVDGDELQLNTCSLTCNAEVSTASTSQLLAGTWDFDASWIVEGNNDWTILLVKDEAGNAYLWLQGEGSPWCGPAPCSGGQHVVVPGRAISIRLDAAEDGCDGPQGDGHTQVSLTGLSFTPDAGIFAHQGTLETADLGSLHGTAAQGAYGSALALLHDVDGDGRPEVAIGTTNLANFPVSANQVIVRSSATGAVLATLTTPKPSDQLGIAVCNPGDLDGDGRDDLLTGGAGTYNTPGSKGIVIAWSSATWTPLWTVTGAADGDRLGQSLTVLGDIDGDGKADIAAGMPGRGGNSHFGGVRAISGATGAQLWATFGSIAFEGLGTTVAAVGDIDGDGKSEVLAGAPGYALFFSGPGSARLVSGLTGLTLATLTGDGPFMEFGASVSAAGDANDDGIPDFAVGEPWATVNAGLVRVYSGATLHQLFSVHGEQGELLGDNPGCLAAIGDANGDGHDDLLIGVPHNTLLAGQPGERHDRLDVISGADGSALLSKELPTEPLSFGQTIATGVDLSGDGLPDWAVAGSNFGAAPSDPSYPTVLLFSGKVSDHVAPLLIANGTLTAGSPFVLTIADGTPSSVAALVVGLHLGNLPFKGGLLAPTPNLVIAGLPLDANGSITLHAAWPAGLSHLPIWMQAWIKTPAALHGFTATNSLALVAP